MRAFTSLYIAVTLVLTANAAIIGKRATSAPVNECITLVNNVKTKLDTLNTSFAAYKELDVTTMDPAAISEIGRNHDQLLDNTLTTIDELNDARNKCCAIPTDSATEEDRKAISGAFIYYAVSAADTFNTLNSKITAFDKSKDPYSITQEIIFGLKEPANTFHQCLVQRAPAADITKATESAAKVDNALKEVAKTFAVPGETEALSSQTPGQPGSGQPGAQTPGQPAAA